MISSDPKYKPFKAHQAAPQPQGQLTHVAALLLVGLYVFNIVYCLNTNDEMISSDPMSEPFKAHQTTSSKLLLYPSHKAD